MRGHFAEGLKLHDAVVRGDLLSAREQAGRLAAHETDVPFPAGAVAFFGLMRLRAENVARARTIEEAAATTAALLSQCGQCHQTMSVRNLVPVTPRTKAGGLVEQMRAHLRASDLLLEGLIVPSSARWHAGAREFARIRLTAGDLTDNALRERARIANARFAGLAATAAKAHLPRERAEAYGRILATCARCHQEHPKIWGPDRQ